MARVIRGNHDERDSAVGRLVPLSGRGSTAGFRAHFAVLRAFAYRRLGDHELAEEIALDSLTLAWRQDDHVIVTREWLFSVARHRIRDALRRRERDRHLIHALRHDVRAHTAAGPRGHLAEILEELPAAERELLVMLYWDGLPATEIARLSGTSVASVWKRASRARQHLRERLGLRGTPGMSNA